MAIRSLYSGHAIYFDGNKWRFLDTKEIVNNEKACCFCGKEPIILKNDKKSYHVDACIAPIVKALNNANIETIASCCGHGEVKGRIALRDGRELVIFNEYEWEKISSVFNKRTIYGEKIK